VCRREGRITATQEVHHIIPLADGGTHEDSNLMALCKSKMPAQLVIDFVRVYDLKTIPLLNETNYTQK
ncbi:MAG: HNH endonuclease, partial [Clostridia bacterium]|nr:HNH endonuclease [Clostridia bacterium]